MDIVKCLKDASGGVISVTLPWLNGLEMLLRVNFIVQRHYFIPARLFLHALCRFHLHPQLSSRRYPISTCQNEKS